MAEQRLIDANAIFPWYVETFKGKIAPNEVRFSMNDIACNLLNIPTIEERKGKWLPDNTNPYAIMFTCSECKESVCPPVTSSFKPIWKYCPNCGAEMRGEEG